MSRVDLARKAYLNKDVSHVKAAHNKEAIHQSIVHGEAHLTDFRLPEIILGGQDGLVNVLGIILGIAAATSSNQLVIIAGLAATFAESISMAAVAYTSRLAEADYYQSEYEREKWEIEHVPDGEAEEIRALYTNFGFKGKLLDDVVATITSNEEVWLRVMMEQELKLEPVDRKKVIPYALVVGFSAVVGSLIPLAPFFFLPVVPATWLALTLTAMALFTVGYYKAKTTLGRSFIKQGLEMMVIGMVSALAGYVVGKVLQVK